MGYMKHHSIIVMGFKKGQVTKARRKAIEIGLSVTNIKETSINGYYLFYVIPDGSKEGWHDSNEGDRMRKEFIDSFPIGYCSYTEVSHDEDEGRARITNQSKIIW